MSERPSPLTPEWVAEQVERIKSIAGDDEDAHGREDDLHQAVLKAISEGDCEDAKACAFAALKTLDIKFARWCA